MRGKIQYRERAAQIRDFSKLRWGNITPTDIDAFIDFGNRVFVIIEAKLDGVELPRGQEIALERLCDNCKVECFVLIVSHNTPIGDDIDFANTLVTKYRTNKTGDWRKVQNPTTCLTFVNWIHENRLESPTPLV